MTWKTIRNENNEIARRQLTESIYIERRYCGNLRTDYWYNVLVIDGEDIQEADTYSGYSINDLKEMGEKHHQESEKKRAWLAAATNDDLLRQLVILEKNNRHGIHDKDIQETKTEILNRMV